MKVVALLPMKANSERVKGKNFKEFAGKPLFQWMLDTLLSIKQIDLIVINTDAREVLKKNGLVNDKRILIRDRRKEICGDLTSMNLVIEDDINNIDADIYLMTHTTNPLLSKKSIINALQSFQVALEKNENDSLFTVNKVQERFYNIDAKPINHDPNNLLRTQDLEAWFKENSNLYLFTKKSFASTNARIGSTPMIFESESYESLDIDTPDDWDFGEVMVEYYRNKGFLS